MIKENDLDALSMAAMYAQSDNPRVLLGHLPGPHRITSLLGGPGVGKDTQADLMQTQYEALGTKVIKVSTGDCLRAAFSDSDNLFFERAQAEKKKSEEGGLVNDTLATAVAYFEANVARTKRADILAYTGFPRTTPQLVDLEQMILQEDVFDFSSDSNNGRKARSLHIIALAGNPDVSRRRAAQRVEESLAKGQTPRKDDLPEIVERRLYEHVSGAAITIAEKIAILNEGKERFYFQDLLRGEASFRGRTRIRVRNPQIPGIDGRVIIDIIDASRTIPKVRNSIFNATASLDC